MLFEFKLRPLAEIEPWTGQEGFLLSWFGFTDGWYRLNVGGDFLFTYSAAENRRLKALHADFKAEWVDYQVVRLWEDVLDILPDILAPIPPRFAALLAGPDPEIVRWLDRVEAWRHTLPDDMPKADEDRFFDAVTWLGARGLDSLYLKAGPRIWFWSTPETVTITWDNRGLEIEGAAVWSTQYGTFSLPREAFLRELQQFHDSLIAQMAQRVEEVCAHWDRPDVHVDFEGLRREQVERASALAKALQREPETVDWTAVLAAADYIESKTP